MLTTIDTLKFALNAERLQDAALPLSHYIHNKDSEGGETYKLKDAARPIGITSITMHPRPGKLVCELSAKILCDGYLQGITRHTIEQAIENLIYWGALPLSSSDIIERAQVLKCDAVNSVYIPDLGLHGKMVVDALSIAKLNSNYEATAYRRERQNIGLAFNGKFKSYKARQIHYYKYIELARSNANNREFFKQCQHPAAILKDAANMWRVETNSTDLKHIRERFNIGHGGPILLTELLASSQRLNYDMLQLITQPQKANTLFTLFDTFSPERFGWNDLITQIGIRGILQHVDYQDTKQLQAFMRAYFNTEAAYIKAWYGRTEKGKYTPGMRDWVSMLQREQVEKNMPAGAGAILESIKKQLAA